MSDVKEVQEASKIVLIEAKSSNIDSFGYSEEMKVMVVQFKGGGLYLYGGVPKEIYQGMVDAESRGKYLNATIKPHYLCAKVE